MTNSGFTGGTTFGERRRKAGTRATLLNFRVVPFHPWGLEPREDGPYNSEHGGHGVYVHELPGSSTCSSPLVGEEKEKVHGWHHTVHIRGNAGTKERVRG